MNLSVELTISGINSFQKTKVTFINSNLSSPQP